MTTAVLVTLVVIAAVELSHYDDVLAMEDNFGRPYSERHRPSPQRSETARLLPERRGVDSDAVFEVSQTNWQGEPVRYDPCRPIAVVVNARFAPAGYVELVDSALAEVSAASGLEFEVEDYAVDERADVARSAYDPERYGDRWSPVLIAWSTPQEFPPLKGDIVGWGGSIYTGDRLADLADRRQWYVSGDVTLDASQLGDDLAEQRIVLLHEIGHVLGLTHVDDPHQVMYPDVESVTKLGRGDLDGFAAIGAGDCAPAL